MTAEARAGHSTVVACSALRKRYRDVLRAAEGNTIFVHVHPPVELTAERIAARAGHFMPSTLLDSQVATLEELEADERGFKVTAAGAPEEVLAVVLEQLQDA
jgi:gluconokinase